MVSLQLGDGEFRNLGRKWLVSTLPRRLRGLDRAECTSVLQIDGEE